MIRVRRSIFGQSKPGRCLNLARKLLRSKENPLVPGQIMSPAPKSKTALMPAGLYSLDPLQSYLCDTFRKAGIKDAFDRLDAEFYIISYNPDTLE
jgi:hypothetical protein